MTNDEPSEQDQCFITGVCWRTFKSQDRQKCTSTFFQATATTATNSSKISYGWTSQTESQATNQTTKPTMRASTSNKPHMCVTSHMGPITSRTDPRLVQRILHRNLQGIPQRDVQGIPQRIDKGLEMIRGNLESSRNFNIILELNEVLAIQRREYCFSINTKLLGVTFLVVWLCVVCGCVISAVLFLVSDDTCTRCAWLGWRNFFPVVLLCQFLVLAGNRFWFYILMYLGGYYGKK